MGGYGRSRFVRFPKWEKFFDYRQLALNLFRKLAVRADRRVGANVAAMLLTYTTILGCGCKSIV
jgi:hypothetical protein